MHRALPPEPQNMDLDTKNNELRITWEEDHHSTYPFRYLRGFCPCAHCQGHQSEIWNFIPVEPEALKINDAKLLGNYALGLTWSDGHSTGIYSWDILRELCPCTVCQNELGENHAMKQYV